jgi:hypothetical protein
MIDMILVFLVGALCGAIAAAYVILGSQED